MVSMTMPEGDQKKRLSMKVADALDDLDSYLALEDEADDTASIASLGSLDEPSASSLADLVGVCTKCKSVTFPISSAIALNHKTCLRGLLERTANLVGCERSADDGTTPIHIAAKHGNRDILSMLLAKDKAMVEVKDARGATVAHVLCYNGHHKCLAWMLTNDGGGADAAKLKDVDGATPVHYAAASGHLECLKQLVETGSGDPNGQTYSGETPIYFAAQEGHLACVQWLFEVAKANPSSSSNDGMTPLHAAAQTGQVNVAHWLVKTAKCPVDSTTCDGATPLHFAAAKGHVAILQWMLHHSLVTGVEPDDFGATPVHDAAEHGQLESLRVFYEHSVDLATPDCDGLTPRDLAVQGNHTNCMEFLSNPEGMYNREKRPSLVDVADATGMVTTPVKKKKWKLFPKKKEQNSK